MTNNNMTNSNLQSVIIRIAFAKGSDEIYVGKTQKGNYTFVGEILHSSDLVISHYNKLIEVNGDSCVGSVGTVCIADNNEAHRLIEEIESIQAGRPVNARGNKYPFVFLRVVTDGDIIFNKGVGGEAHRLTFLDVELVEVEADAPDEVIGINNPQVQAPSRSTYGTVRYRPQVKANTTASVVAARAGLSSPSPTSHEAETEADSTVPTFNTKTIVPTAPSLRSGENKRAKCDVVEEESKDQKIASLESELAQMKTMMEKLLQSQKVEV